MLELTGIQKITNRYQDVNKNKVKFKGENSGKCRVRKQQTENGHSNKRMNGHDTIVRNGLDEEIQTNNRKDTIGRNQPI